GLYFVGLLAPLATSLYFKFFIAPVPQLIAHRNAEELLAKVLDWHRYTTTLESYISTAWSFGHWTLHPFLPLLALMIVCGVDRQTVRSKGWINGFAIVALLLIGYYGVYILTPYELRYHLDTSLERLFMHVWPAILLLLGLAIT